MSDPEPLAPLTSPIVCDSNIFSGRPVFRGTRVPVDVLFDNLADGLTVDELLESYPSLNRDDVLTALDLGRQRILGSVA